LEARRLRCRGWTLRPIAIELGVSIASVSVWVRDLAAPQPRRDASRLNPVEPDDTARAVTRRCSRCRQTLVLSAFNRHGEGHQWWCRECFREYFRIRGDLHRKQSNDAHQRRRREARAFLRRYLSSHPCVDCGERDPVILEFDHIGPKRTNVGWLAAAGCSVTGLLREIAVCEVVCVNCHRRRTASRDGSWRLEPGRLERSTSLLLGEARNLAFVRDTLLKSDCVDCGVNDLLLLEFDHVAEKRSNVPARTRSPWLPPCSAQGGDRQMRGQMRQLPPASHVRESPSGGRVS